MKEFIYRDPSEARWDDILANHKEEARERALSLITDGIKTDTGCIVTDTEAIRKVRFRSQRWRDGGNAPTSAHPAPT